MKSSIREFGGRWVVLLAMVMGTAAVLVAQEPLPPPPPPAGHAAMMMGGPGMMGAEFGDGKVVKGVPLSAELVVIRETTLADGNKIHNESQSKIYRDAEGRVRREMGVDMPMPAMGPVKHSLTVISDPVAGVRYVLNPENKTARQTPMHGPKAGMPDHESHMKAMGMDGNVSKEQLGTKAVNGVQAEGVRVTRTIAAGTMGNEKPITVVTERWYSPELQMVVMTTHSDPMMGTVTSKLVNVTPGAPDAALFQVPSDYSLKADKPGEPFTIPFNH